MALKRNPIEENSGSETSSTTDSWEDETTKFNPRKASPTILLQDIVRIHDQRALDDRSALDDVRIRTKNESVPESRLDHGSGSPQISRNRFRNMQLVEYNNLETSQSKGHGLFESMSAELQMAMTEFRKMGKGSVDEQQLMCDVTRNKESEIPVNCAVTKGVKPKLTISKLNSVKCLLRNVITQGDKRNQETSKMSVVVDSQDKETPLQNGGHDLKGDIKSTLRLKLNARTAHELSHARANRLLKERGPFARDFLPIMKLSIDEDTIDPISCNVMLANPENPIYTSSYGYDTEEHTSRFRITSKNYNSFFDDEVCADKSTKVDWKRVQMSKEKCMQWFDKYFVP